MEVDFSRVMIAGTILAFTNESTEEYINKLWLRLVNKQDKKPPLFCVHVCRFHILRNFAERIRKKWPGKRLKKPKEIDEDIYDPIRFLMKWINCVVRTTTMEDFHRRLKDIGIISGMKYATSVVKYRLQNMDGDIVDNDQRWKTFDITAFESSKEFWRRCSFSRYAEFIFSKLEIENQQVCLSAETKGYELNPLYSKDFLNYLKVYFYPFYGNLSHLCFYACGLEVEDDTTNAIENYHGLLKLNFYEGLRDLRVSYFVQDQVNVITGICNKAEAAYEQTTPQRQRLQIDQRRSAVATLEEHYDDEYLEFKDEGISPPTNERGKEYTEEEPRVQREGFKLTPRSPRTDRGMQDWMALVPLIPAGGYFHGKKKIPLTNTCCIDAILNGLVAMKYSIPEFSTYVQKQFHLNDRSAAIIVVIEAITNGRVDAAKTEWVKSVMKVNLDTFSGNCYGSEYDNALQFLGPWFPVCKINTCPNTLCIFKSKIPGSQKTPRELFNDNMNVCNLSLTSPIKFIQFLNMRANSDVHCKCGTKFITEIEFKFSNNPVLIYRVRPAVIDPFPDTDLPITQTIKGVSYKVFGYTCLLKNVAPNGEQINHYILKFIRDGKIVVYDSLLQKPKVQRDKPKNHYVSTIFLIRQ